MSLPNFDPVSTPKKCCNRPEIVAIAEIATLFFRWEALEALARVKLWTAFLLSVAKCVLDLQYLGVAT